MMLYEKLRIIGAIMLIGMVVFIIVYFVWLVLTDPTIEVVEYELVALVDVTQLELSGTFFLASGYVSGSEQWVLRYAVKTTNGISLKSHHISASVFIQEKEDVIPVKRDYYEVRKVLFPLGWRKKDIIKTCFVIPPGGLLKTHEVDLR